MLAGTAGRLRLAWTSILDKGLSPEIGTLHTTPCMALMDLGTRFAKIMSQFCFSQLTQPQNLPKLSAFLCAPGDKDTPVPCTEGKLRHGMINSFGAHSKHRAGRTDQSCTPTP